MPSKLVEWIDPMREAYEKLKVDEASFLVNGVDYYQSMINESGQEPVLRSLSLLSTFYRKRDSQVHNKAESLLRELPKGIAIQEDLLETCPVCDTPGQLRLHKCRTCGFSFVEHFICPYLTESERICVKDRTGCSVIGLEFENCEKFLKGDKG